MRVRFLLGPAGTGKTFRCLTEIRQALVESQAGPPLLLVVPKQTTYQLERRLLADDAIPGYTRLRILSFERLAHFVFEQLGIASPDMLDEEGRVMVLRSLLAKKRDGLKLFRASSRLTGFAQQLSLILRELQRNQLTPQALRELARQMRSLEGLAHKLNDLATLLAEYLTWLQAHNLQDADCLLSTTAEILAKANSPVPKPQAETRPLELFQDETSSLIVAANSPLRIESLWVDGFAEFSKQELDLLAALVPLCRQATLTFCLAQAQSEKHSWLSCWSVVRKSFEDSRKRLSELGGTDVSVEVLVRDPAKTRFFDNPVLAHLEKPWADPRPFHQALQGPPAGDTTINAPRSSRLNIVTCVNPEAEATMAAREIRHHIRSGGRYREVTVLVRNLENYHQPLQRVFARYEIPFFLDRRESVSHHPLAELTRSALRTVVSHWLHEDWFGALKSGLVPVNEEEIDRLENEALARGWKGAIWQNPIVLPEEPETTRWLGKIHSRILPPFQRLALALAAQQNKPTGPQLAAALREFWDALQLEDRLQEWASAETASSEFQTPSSVHATVWDQMNAWLQNVELAFATEALSLREWLPILDAGLANLTVGLIPPALDQVLIGAIDRSRNPDIKLALILGMNEGVFPAAPSAPTLLTDADRQELESRNIRLGSTARQQLARERFHGYLACTRARARLVLSHALHDTDGTPLNPSPFLSHVQQLFPSLKPELVSRTVDWRESEHVSELVGPLLKAVGPRVVTGPVPQTSPALLDSVPVLSRLLDSLRNFQMPTSEDSLRTELVQRLYGSVLRTSVSRIEQFAACPFKFFVHSGLRAEERKRFELDAKEQGNFQHDALAFFHEELRRENKRWRDISPAEARERIKRVCEGLMFSYREGLMQASDQTRFTARVLSESLQNFVEVLVSWMHTQYRFDPVQVELPFGQDATAPGWAIELLPPSQAGTALRLELQGRIDRIDLFREPSQPRRALAVVVDYKSSQKKLDPVLMEHGLQLQLLAYLNVLRHWPAPRAWFGVDQLIPSGVFYVNLHGRYERARNRRDALENTTQTRKLAYRHTGRFDANVVHLLDSRPGSGPGDQFSFRFTNNGRLHGGSREALATEDFQALLDSVESNLKKMGTAIFAGQAKVDPFRKGVLTACQQCEYRAICRLDPWTHNFRVLKHGARAIQEGE